MMVALAWLKALPIRPWMIWTVVAIVAYFYVQGVAQTSQELKQVQKEQVEQQATRKKAVKANEKIKSSPDFITDWMRDNGHFRD
jgi:hypothetical protein